MLHYKFAAVIVFMQISIYTFVNIFSATSHSEYRSVNIFYKCKIQFTSSDFFYSSLCFFLCVTSNSDHVCEYFLQVQILTYTFRFFVLQVLTLYSTSSHLLHHIYLHKKNLKRYICRGQSGDGLAQI